MLHIPILRHGKPYTSVDTSSIPDFRTRQPYASLSQANVGLIRRDLLQQERMRESLARIPVRDLIALSAAAAEHFLKSTLPIGEEAQTPEQYVQQCSATTGLPHIMVRKNMGKIHGVMAKVEDVIRGLTRGVDLEVLDRGFTFHGGQALSFFPRGNSLGVVLPSNSPGVHSLWAPAFAMKTPLVLKPGGSEPWTPYRIIQAFIKAGAPPEAFCYYPTDHAGGGEILRSTGRGMLFGDVGVAKLFAGDPRIEIHGPGYSKILIAEDEIGNWEKYLNVMVASIAENSGRSCVNASGVWVPKYGREIAEALAKRLAAIQPRSAEDPDAQLAPFADPKVAARISGTIDDGLREPGARDVTAEYRSGPRLSAHDGCTYLLPTIVECEHSTHELANREFLFPFASVVTGPQSDVVERMGSSLVVTAITNDPRLKARLLASPHVGRLNFGAIPTMQISWDQPHEGNLFEHLYARRAFQAAAGA